MTRLRLRPASALVALVLCCSYQSHAEDKPLKADLQQYIGKPVLSRIVLGCKAKPSGQWAVFPVNTLVYPDSDRVVFRVESGMMRSKVTDRELKQQFIQGTAFNITDVEIKGDRLEVSLKSSGGDFAKLKLMLGAGWESKVDVSSVETQLSRFFVLDEQPPLPTKVSPPVPAQPTGPAEVTGPPQGATQNVPPIRSESAKPRVYLVSTSIGNEWNALRNQSLEMAKDFQKDCPGVQVTMSPENASYTVTLNHIEHDLSRDNQMAVVDRAGDLLLSREKGSIGASVKAACLTILTDWNRAGK